MKKIRVLCLLLALLTVIPFFSSGAEQELAISFRVEGPQKSMVNLKSVSVKSGATALEATEQVLKELKITYTTQKMEESVYINSVDNLFEGSFGGYDGWLYCVNGASPTLAISDYKLKAGDALVLYYGDLDTLIPELKAEAMSGGNVRLTFTAQSYDQDFNPVTVPVINASVTVNGHRYNTDLDGKVVLSTGDSERGIISLQVESYDASKTYKGSLLPTVLRFADDFTLDTSSLTYVESRFTDIPEGAWYKEYVDRLSALGIINGKTETTFEPLANITRAEFVKILALVSGDDIEGYLNYAPFLSDVTKDRWFFPYVTWAYQEGIISDFGDPFLPDSMITREDMALMLSRCLTAMGKELKSDHPAPLFHDANTISDKASEHVYLLQKAGVVLGTNNNFNPKDNATRAEACKMVVGALDAIKP